MERDGVDGNIPRKKKRGGGGESSDFSTARLKLKLAETSPWNPQGAREFGWPRDGVAEEGNRQTKVRTIITGKR